METLPLNDIIKAQDILTPWGEFIMLFGKISATDGRYIREVPSTTARNLTWIEHGTNLFIDRIYTPHLKEPLSRWFHIYDNKGNVGWVSNGVMILPDGKYLGPVALDFDTSIHYVIEGESLESISLKYYKQFIKRGNDKRFYIGALAYVNKFTDGITIPSNFDFTDDESWNQLSKIRAGASIWIPSNAILQPLKEKISSGSWIFDKVYFIHRVSKEIFKWAVGGVGFVAGVLQGAIVCVYDIFADAIHLIKMVMDFVKNIFTGQIFKVIESIYNTISKIIDNASDIVNKMVDNFKAKWNNSDAWERWKFRGFVIGYLLGFAIITYLTLGASLYLKAMSKATRFAQVAERVAISIQKIPKFIEVVDSFTNPLEWATAGAHFKGKIDLDNKNIKRVAPLESRALNSNGVSGVYGSRGLPDKTPTQKLENFLPIVKKKALVVLLKRFDLFKVLWLRVYNDNTRDKLKQVRNSLVKGEIKLAKKQAELMYNNYRRRFWGAVWDNKELKDKILETGAIMDKRRNAPFFLLDDGRKEYITLDHKIRVLERPDLVVEVDNLQFALGYENTVNLELIRNNDIFYKLTITDIIDK